MTWKKIEQQGEERNIAPLNIMSRESRSRIPCNVKAGINNQQNKFSNTGKT